MLSIIQKRKYTYIFSGAMMILAIISLSLWGLKLGIDFTGGSLLQIDFTSRPPVEELQQVVNSVDLGNIIIQPTEQSSIFLRLKDINQAEYQKLVDAIKNKYSDSLVTRFEFIGPTLGSELSKRAVWAIALACLFIILYIAFAFRKVSRPMASWKYGLTAVIALIHDVLITVGLFAILGHFFNVEIDSLFVSAILTVLGFSVHDTIVVYDRIRENLFHGVAGNFEEVVNKSVNDTLVRSINTSLTVELVLLALFFLGGATIHYFALALMIGVAFGTYSSIFVASALLVDWYKLSAVKR